MKSVARRVNYELGVLFDASTQQHDCSGQDVSDNKITAGARQNISSASEVAAILEIGEPIRQRIVETKATCPFIGPAVATGLLPIRQDANNPLAAIEDVRMLGNTGGGDLGDLLTIFASGNHAFMRGDSGKLDRPVPAGLFSLELPGSQGSHPGHSGILQGDPSVLGSGRFSPDDFERLVSRAQAGLIKRSDVARFIAENLHRDPKATVIGRGTATLLALDLNAFVLDIGPALLTQIDRSAEEGPGAHRELEEKLTRLLGEDNLIGSAGEFGLLFAFFANRPGAKMVDGEPALPIADLHAMFVEKRFPDGWERWKKRRIDWVINTTALIVDAGKAYLSGFKDSGG